MKRLQRLAHVLLDDLGVTCCVDTARDHKTISRRIKHEGDEFLTITLPTFGKDFDKSLDQGRVADDRFLPFRKNGGLPAFLQGFLQQVFDAKSGTLLMEPSVEAIYAVRQFSMAFGKIFDLPTPSRRFDAMRNFISTEQEIRAHERHIDKALRNEGSEGLWPGQRADDYARCTVHRPYGRMELPFLGAHPRRQGSGLHCWDAVPSASGGDATPLSTLRRHQRQAVVLLFGDLLAEADHLQWRQSTSEEFHPQHGTGATADRLWGNEKYTLSEWPSRLEESAPFLEWALPSVRHHAYQDRVTFLSPEQERPVRVISVPKTAKTPRIIAIEPTAMQYVQQAYGRFIVRKLESDRLTAPLIGFTDQIPNQEMAREGSLTGKLATLDLSEASDRVSNLHVVQMLDRWPSFQKAIQDCRSTKADVRGFGIIPLAKYASMGSGLTFPIESMFFLSIVVSSIAWGRRVPLTRRFIKDLHGRVRVYGDDIIVPTDDAESVITGLEAFGLKVNRDKSFWTGLFRESCGGDFYAGERVTPVRVRQKFPSSRKDGERIASLVSLRNQMYEAGLWTTARWLDHQIVRVLPHFPIVEPTSAILGRRSLSFLPRQQGFKSDTQVPVVRGFAQVARLPENPLDDVHALMKWFLHKEGPGKDPSMDFLLQEEPMAEDHLLRSGRAKSVLKLGWHRPF